MSLLPSAVCYAAARTTATCHDAAREPRSAMRLRFIMCCLLRCAAPIRLSVDDDITTLPPLLRHADERRCALITRTLPSRYADAAFALF